MKYFTNIFVAAVMVGLGMGSMQVEAAPVQYTINDYSSEQEGATISGTITVDDNGDGNLLAAEITDWQISVTGHPSHPNVSFGTSTQTNTSANIWGYPRVSATEISILNWEPAANKGDLVLTGTSDAGVMSKVIWSRDAAWGVDGARFVFESGGNTYWNRAGGGTLGGNAIWIIASGGVSLAPPDADDDGVADADDQCAGTPAGEAVDADGCSDSQKDSDADGVSDADDQCAGTSAGETVDGNGCSDSQRDSDSDGVTDNADLCANTPAGATVDADGCDGFTLLAECETALEASEANCLACDDLEAIVIDVICTMFNIAPSTSKAEFDQETTALANAVLSAAVFCAPDDAASCLTQILDNL
jgi:hypothetical protein